MARTRLIRASVAAPAPLGAESQNLLAGSEHRVERLVTGLHATLHIRGECAVGSFPRSASNRRALIGAYGEARSRYDSPMLQINTFLTFNTQAEEAARFYTSIFPNSQITRVTHYPDLGPQSPKAGSVMTVEFTLDGREFTALNGGPQFTFSQGISIAVLCDTQQQVDEYWDRFVKAGGTPVACGWITDHFGVSWQIDPKLLIDAIADPDPVKAGKAMEAMMTMVKIDSAGIKRALAR
jgi:predicted 3-demethylubiquinone-9 3-methyltransferase (glyoxalase superfamily)